MEQKYHDVSLTTKVYEAILDEPSLRPFDINVRTQKGVVELSGYVNSRDDMDKAIEVARKIEGIKSIKNYANSGNGGFLVRSDYNNKLG